MSDQDGRQAAALPRPSIENVEAWKAYWQAQNQPWRTEPEIDTERQQYLAEIRSIAPHQGYGIFPFKDIDPKLSRADVEWLLASHENGRGPVDWADEKSRYQRYGLNLGFADLRKVSLRGLPLTKCDFREAHLEGAVLLNAQLQAANLSYAQLESAGLENAQLKSAFLSNAQLKSAQLHNAHLEGAKLQAAHLEDA